MVSRDNTDIIKLNKNDRIQFKNPSTRLCDKKKVLGRAIKLTSNRPDKNWFNVETEEESYSVNLDAVPFKIFESHVNEIHFTEIIPRNEHKSSECLEAKRMEIEKLNTYGSYEVVNTPKETNILGHTWVMVRKNGGVRARLTAKGFQEDVIVRSDSPTIGKSTFRVMLAITVMKGWIIKTTDISSAFLQGDKIERAIYMKPPEEACVAKNKVWKITKPLYGLNDASRKFFLKVSTILKRCGCEQSIYDPALFIYRDTETEELCGIVGTHVDDFIHAGNSKFEAQVMEVIYKEFTVGTREVRKFRYTGFNINQADKQIVVDQMEYIRKVKIQEPKERKTKNQPLNEEELSMLRSNVGALQWMARGTRPDICFDAIDLSTRTKSATFDDLQRSVKALKRLKIEDEMCKYVVPNLGNYKDWKLHVSSDASWGNHADNTNSMSGHIVLLVGEGGKCVPLAWESGKIQRVVNSTIAAEMLACKKGLEDAFYIKTIIKEVTQLDLTIQAFVDHKGAVQSINSTNSMVDKRLRVDTAAIRQMIERGEVGSVSHCAGKDQLADALTKRGADGRTLLNLINAGRLE